MESRSFFVRPLFQFMCFIAHFTSAIVLFSYAASEPEVGEVQIYISDYTRVNNTYKYTMERHSRPNLFYLIASFSVITAAFHFMYFSEIYLYDNIETQNYRMIEYSITASIMISIISILVGIREVYTLISLSILICSTMLFGYIQEKIQVKMFLAPYFMGWAPYSFAWGVILSQFIRSIEKVGLPDYVYVLFSLEFIIYSCFAIVSFYYTYLPYVYGYVGNKERMQGLYHILSLSAKMILVWVSFVGIRDQNSPQNLT